MGARACTQVRPGCPQSAVSLALRGTRWVLPLRLLGHPQRSAHATSLCVPCTPRSDHETPPNGPVTQPRGLTSAVSTCTKRLAGGDVPSAEGRSPKVFCERLGAKPAAHRTTAPGPFRAAGSVQGDGTSSQEERASHNARGNVSRGAARSMAEVPYGHGRGRRAANAQREQRPCCRDSPPPGVGGQSRHGFGDAR